MSNKLCRQAIETRLATWAAARSQALSVAWENVSFKPPAGAYLRGYLLPANTTSPTLGGDVTTYQGVYQVSVVCPINTGPGEAEGIAAEIAAQFPVNARLTASGLTVQITTPPTSTKGGQDQSEYVIPVWFQYRADT